MPTPARRTHLITAALCALFLSAPAPAAANTAAHDPPEDGRVSAQWMVTGSSAATPAAKQQARPRPLPDGRSSIPHPRTPADDGRQRAQAEDDLKLECATHAESLSPMGWTKDRFQRCFLGFRTVNLIRNQVPVATVTFDYSLLVFAHDGTRQIDYVFTLDKLTWSGELDVAAASLRVGVDGCDGGDIQCVPFLPERVAPLAGWRLASHFNPTYTSPDTAGSGEDKIVSTAVTLNMGISGPTPDVVPWFEPAMAVFPIRFDTAGAKAGKHKGAVFPDYKPTFDLLELADKRGERALVIESARHIHDALNHPERTFPSFLGKSIPGKYRPDKLPDQQNPLRRLVDDTLKDNNRRQAGRVCADVWGQPPHPGQDCDEYPFASTYEGAYTSTNQGQDPWHGSARLIDSDDNQRAGQLYLDTDFYRVHRILDRDAYFVRSSL
jgi:hypothetical protein